MAIVTIRTYKLMNSFARSSKTISEYFLLDNIIFAVETVQFWSAIATIATASFRRRKLCFLCKPKDPKEQNHNIAH